MSLNVGFNIWDLKDQRPSTTGIFNLNDGGGWPRFFISTTGDHVGPRTFDNYILATLHYVAKRSRFSSATKNNKCNQILTQQIITSLDGVKKR